MALPSRLHGLKRFSVLDFGAHHVRAISLEKKEGGGFDVLGAGESVSRGVSRGEFTHLGDAVECVSEAVRRADQAAGVKTETLYFGYDDPGTESLLRSGSKQLSGEGQVRFEDIRDARLAAERSVGHFEKSIIYSREVYFLIDERDRVDQPIGVFGRKLDVCLHMVLARSAYYDLWRRLMRRAEISRAIPVLSSWATAYGVTTAEERAEPVLVWDLGDDYVSGCVFHNRAIVDYWSKAKPEHHCEDTVIELSQRFREAHGRISKVRITGDWASDGVAERLAAALNCPCQIGHPSLFHEWSSPCLSSLMGLVLVADELESRRGLFKSERGLLSSVRNKATSFLNDYF